MLWANLAGLALIALIVWWFWLYRPPAAKPSNSDTEIRVEQGVYQPAHLEVPAGRRLTLNFRRIDPSPCADAVIFPELAISQNLDVNKSTRVELPPLEQGEYQFHCQMQMYRGKLRVK